jgi:hypothetical protein
LYALNEPRIGLYDGGLCAYGDETPGYITIGSFLVQLHQYYLFTEDPTPIQEACV